MYIDAELHLTDSLHSDRTSTTHSDLPETPPRISLEDGWDVKRTYGLYAARRGMHRARVHLTRLRREARARREALVRNMFENGRELMDIARALVARRREDEQLLLRWRRLLHRYRNMDSELRRVDAGASTE